MPEPPHAHTPTPSHTNEPSDPTAPPPPDWWLQAHHRQPTPSEQRGHPCATHEMLTLVAYDITCPKRLAKVARLCEDHGFRIQYSVFECRLPAHQFQDFWQQLLQLIDHETDRLVAYHICATCAKDILTAGPVTLSTTHITYVY